MTHVINAILGVSQFLFCCCLFPVQFLFVSLIFLFIPSHFRSTSFPCFLPVTFHSPAFSAPIPIRNLALSISFLSHSYPLPTRYLPDSYPFPTRSRSDSSPIPIQSPFLPGSRRCAFCWSQVTPTFHARGYSQGRPLRRELRPKHGGRQVSAYFLLSLHYTLFIRVIWSTKEIL